MGDSHYVQKEPCPKCGSRDNLARYSDGHGHCFGCGHYEPGDEPGDESVDEEVETNEEPQRLWTPVTGSFHPLSARKITATTCTRWNYQCGMYHGKPVQIANYMSEKTNYLTLGQKFRFEDKRFASLGDISGALYGKWLWKNTGRRVIITEGEIDALTVDQVLEYKWQVVSPAQGVQSAKKTIAKHLEWFAGFDEIVLCFDMDKPGQDAVRECAMMFPPGKVRVVKLPLKDPNEMLQHGREAELVRALWDATAYRPDGIVTVKDIRSKVLLPPETGLPWCLPSLSNATYGRRYGETVALGAGTGVGKTTLITQQIAADLSDGHPVAVFAFEQEPQETIKRVAGQIAHKTFFKPNSGWEQDDLVRVIDSSAIDRLYLYDHFGACDWAVVKERMRYLRHAHGVRLFYLDHLTALAAQADDERVALEKIMADTASIVKELDAWLLFVSHLSTPDGVPHEEGGRVKIRHFKGSRAIGYWSHFMFGLERNQQADDQEDRGMTSLRVLKDRYTGQSTGLQIPLTYDPETGLLVEGATSMSDIIEGEAF